MDFFTLSRKQLQALCKKNKIPANITNLAMAEALSALDQVEGLDEILNPTEGDLGTPSVQQRTAVRASTQRKATRGEAEGLKVSVTVTPSASRRKVTAVSTRRRKEVEVVEDANADKNEVQEKVKPSDLPITPAAAPVSRARAAGRSVRATGGASVQGAYNTRRSVRLSVKDLSKMSLVDTKIGDDVSQEFSNISQQLEDSFTAERGASLQTESTVVSEDAQELEVCSVENKTEYESQSHDSGSDVKLAAVAENDMVVEPLGPNEAEPEKVKCSELEAEPHGSDEAGSDLSHVLEGSCDSSEVEIENNECFGARQDTLPVEASEVAIQEGTGQDMDAEAVVVPDDVPENVTEPDVAVSLPIPAECKMNDKVSSEPQVEAEPHELKPEGSEVLSVLEESSDESELHIENKESSGVIQDILPSEASEDANMDVSVQDTAATLTVGVLDDVEGNQDVSPFEASDDALMEVMHKDTATSTDVVPEDVFDQDMSPLSEAPEDMMESVEFKADDDVIAANESDLMAYSEGGVFKLESGKLQVEQLEAKPEQLEAKTEKIDNALQNDASCENSGAVIQDIVLEAVNAIVLDGKQICESNTLVDGDVVLEDTAIPKQEQTTTEGSIPEQKSNDISVQSVVSDQLKGEVRNTNVMKESVISDDLKNKSIRELKKLLKWLTLDENKNCNTNPVKEV
ncbi:hypothetical protein Fmac_022660 [Flemingia macrophylla]|uniref:Uncharacterized protein n=1 Tax=Flemingia macrophylla TaxID=520843 RepID=A0ABD1M0C2_9FABA